MHKVSGFLLMAFLVFSCTKKTESFTGLKIADYYPVAVGHSWTYQLDSTVITAFGGNLTIHSYLLKDTAVESFTDYAGRMNILFQRYIKLPAAVNWQYVNNYTVTINGNKIELTENNLRYIKLASPLNFEATWKGNSYIDSKSVGSAFKYLDDWSYQYLHINEAFTVIKGSVDSTVTVFHHDEIIGNPGPVTSNAYQQKIKSFEVYAKGIGLIYKEFLYYTWQPAPLNHYEDGSYGIKLSLVEYK